MRLLVTGSEGFVGRHAVAAARAAGHDLREWDLLLDDDMAEGSVHSFDAVINCAGVAGVGRSFRDPEDYWRNNAWAAAALFASARRERVPVVHCSSSLAPFPSHSPYAASKSAAELAAAFENVQGGDVRVVRIHNVYGPGQPSSFIVPRFLEIARGGGAFPIEGGGRVRKDYVYVADVADALLAALGAPPGVYHAATGVVYAPREVAALAASLCGLATRFEEAAAPPWRAADPETPADFTAWKGRWRARTALAEGMRLTRDAMLAKEK